MEFFSDAVDMLETIVVALGAGLQTWGELKNGEKCQAITREFINRGLMRKSRMSRLYLNMNPIMSGGGERPPPSYFVQKSIYILPRAKCYNFQK